MSSDDTTDRFLETVDDGSEPKTAGDITLASGVRWVDLGLAMIGSLIVTWFLGLAAFIRGITQFFVEMYPPNASAWTILSTSPSGGVLDSLTRFFVRLGNTIFGAAATWIDVAVAETTLFIDSTFTGWLAIFAFPAGVAIVLAGLWVAAQGLEVIFDG